MSTKPSRAVPLIFQLKVTLKDSNPPIWRKVQVPSDMTLSQLHDTLQIAVGWGDCYLHQFIVGTTRYSSDELVAFHEGHLPETACALNQIATGKGYTFTYDYGLNTAAPTVWVYTIVIEKILIPNLERSYPRCLSGQRACPVERIGQIEHYKAHLKAVHGDSSAARWVINERMRREFDPERFDPRAVNRQLQGVLH